MVSNGLLMVHGLSVEIYLYLLSLGVLLPKNWLFILYYNPSSFAETIYLLELIPPEACLGIISVGTVLRIVSCKLHNVCEPDTFT
jgi:hypothetical protein